MQQLREYQSPWLCSVRKWFIISAKADCESILENCCISARNAHMLIIKFAIKQTRRFSTATDGGGYNRSDILALPKFVIN